MDVTNVTLEDFNGWVDVEDRDELVAAAVAVFGGLSRQLATTALAEVTRTQYLNPKT